MEARDEFMIRVPDGASLPRFATNYDGVIRAMAELGRYARVRRVTEGELARDVTKDFAQKPVLDYPEDGDWRPKHTKHMSATGAFGRR